MNGTNGTTDESVKFMPLIPIENVMNEGDQDRLLQYLDPEFLNAIPDEKAIDMDLLAIEFKEKLNLRLDTDDNWENREPRNTEDTCMMAPREYQYELFQKATSENIIAVLGTGAGKTLISVMLLKHMSIIERQERLIRRHTKVSFFLVALVPLVFQQAKVIRANCDVVLHEICGSMDVDSWTEKQWEPIFEESDVCVMTAQVFLDVLRRGFLSLDKVNLIIFDECHHAIKKHPFNLIMREFYDRCPIDSRPKIFGMTASPLIDNSNIQSSITKLEKNLDCRVYTATNVEEIDVYVPKPHEYTLVYDVLPSGYNESPLTKMIRQKLDFSRFSFFCNKMEDILRTLGPWCCEQRWRSLLNDINNNISVEDLGESILLPEDVKVKEAIELCKTVEFKRNPDTSDRSLFSPKVDRLISSLKFESQNPVFRAIVFVERRETALALHGLIESIDHFNHIKSAVMTGHGTKEEGDIRLNYHQQNRTIEAFSKGEVKLLIATNVAEEGLDIQPCNYVYRFDAVYALISYIQSRGRARRQNSKYIILTPKLKPGDTFSLNDMKNKEKELNEFCRAMPAERNVAKKFSRVDPEEYDDSEDEDYLEDSLFIPDTGAIITKQNAIPLIFQYCTSLPSDSFCQLQPVFEIVNLGPDMGFKCCLRLPINAPFTEVHSPICKSKHHAKAYASLDACKRLRTLKHLDNHLRPFDFKKELLGDLVPEFDANGMVIGSRRRHNMYEKRTPQLWEKITLVDDDVIEVENDTDLLKARTSKVIEQLDVSTVNNASLENSSDPFDQLFRIQEPSSSNIQAPSLDCDGDLIMFDDSNGNGDDNKAQIENSVTENSMNGDTEINPNEKEDDEDLGEGPFTHWISILEIVTSDNKVNGLPYRQLCIISRKPIPALPQLKLLNKNQSFYVNVHGIDTEISFDKDRITYLYKYMMQFMKTLLYKDFTCPLNDIPYFILPMITGYDHNVNNTATVNELENLIDWAEIDRIVRCEQVPFVPDPEVSTKDMVLLDSSNSGVRFVVEEIRYDLKPTSAVPADVDVRENGYATFQDYYIQKQLQLPKNLEQPIIHARRLKRKLNFISVGEFVEPKIKGGAHAFLVPEFCKVYHTSLSVLQAFTLVPSIMIRIDSLLLLKEAKIKYDLNIEDNTMLEAFTTPSACMEMNYERLEILGDSLLKFISTISLYVNFPLKDEGQLHLSRIRIVCNKALYRAAKRLKFYRYITSHAFAKRFWRPPHFVSKADNPETMNYLKYHGLSDKTLADIVESLLGASYISSGLESVLNTAIQMQIPLDNITCWSDILHVFNESRKEAPPRVAASALESINMEKITEITGYRFNNPLLVVEALTHASLPKSQVPCYQRLEFLGDAVLDFLVVRYLYTKYSKATPGEITELKDSCVNNNVLSIVCLDVGLHKHIIHYSGKIIKTIQDFENQIQQVRDSGKASGEYWRDVNIPKILSDVVESMLGAIFVDSGFDIRPVEALFDKWFLQTFEEHVSPGYTKTHPVTKLIHIFQRFGCEGFKLRNQTTNGTGDDSQQCVIFLHDKPLANGSDSNIKVARRNAATRALKRLEDEPGILDAVCNCRIPLLKRQSSTGALENGMDDAMDEDED